MPIPKVLVFAKPPPEAEKQHGVLWKVLKCAYGLKDAARHWFEKMKSAILATGCVSSSMDPCLFYLKDDENNLIGLLATHVDDIWWAGTRAFKEKVICYLERVFEIRSQESPPFQHLGFKVTQDDNRIVLDLAEYVLQLKEVTVPKSDDTINQKDRSNLRSALGKLQWVASQARPDIAFSLSRLLAQDKERIRGHFMLINKLIRKLRFSLDKCRLIFEKSADVAHWSIRVYSDASLNNLPCGRTQSGHLVLLETPGSRPCLLNWQSQKLRRIVRSTICGETIACVDAVDAAYLCQQILKEVMGISVPIVCSTDNRSLVDNVFSTKVQHDKRLRIEIAYLRTMVESGVISRLQWVPTNEQLADCLTRYRTTLLMILFATCMRSQRTYKPAVLEEAFTEEANARLRLPSESFSSFGDVFKYGNMLLSVFILQMNDWWGL